MKIIRSYIRTANPSLLDRVVITLIQSEPENEGESNAPAFIVRHHEVVFNEHDHAGTTVVVDHPLNDIETAMACYLNYIVELEACELWSEIPFDNSHNTALYHNMIQWVNKPLRSPIDLGEEDPCPK